jgi:hypothetical protein
METLVLTLKEMETWKLPPFQAPLKANAKVQEVADELMNMSGDAVITGVITLGKLPGDTSLYLLDGQHRRHGFKLSGRDVCFADVRTKEFDSMQEMAEEYRKLNTPLSRKTPDDVLRAMEEGSKPLQMITRACGFIGYRYIRANPEAPLVGMAAVLRRWRGSGFETPAVTGGASAYELGATLQIKDAEQIIEFMSIAFSAWGKDMETQRLWQGLNMTMCMWLWRILVLDQDRMGARRYVALNVEQYKRCLMSLAADREYTDWLAGRTMTERDRAPCYRRLRVIFQKRLHDEIGKFRMPQPQWMNN